MTVAITACGYIDDSSFSGSRTGFSWKSTDPSLRWNNISNVPFDRFGRLDALSKFAVIAVEMLDLPVTSSRPRVDWAVCSATGNGCVTVDAEFCHSMNRFEGASPLLFTYTLPSSSMAEIAIRYRILGNTICFMCGDDKIFTILREGADLIESGIATSCICVACDAISPMTAKYTNYPPGSSATSFLVENVHSARENHHHSLATVNFERNDCISHHDDAKSIAKKTYDFLSRPEGESSFILKPSRETSRDILILRRHVNSPSEEQI